MRNPTALAARSGLVIAMAIVLTVSGVSRLVGSPSDQSRLDPNALRRSLSDARARWSARKPGNYEFVLSIPLGEDWWSRRFASYRVAAGASTTIAPPTGPLADVFRKSATVDALFDLIAERLDGSTDGGVAEFDNDLGYPTNVFIGAFSFVVPTFRTLLNGSAVDPFVLLQHVNHCAFSMPDPTALGPCPEYSIAMWGGGTVVYVGSSGVRTVGRRQHEVSSAAVQELTKAMDEAAFSTLESDYSSVSIAGGQRRSIDHSAEKWLTIRAALGQRTVHDFYGAPAALLRLESAVERIADSYRYTGLKPGSR